jgi:hypothetical protein
MVRQCLRGTKKKGEAPPGGLLTIRREALRITVHHAPHIETHPPTRVRYSHHADVLQYSEPIQLPRLAIVRRLVTNIIVSSMRLPCLVMNKTR